MTPSNTLRLALADEIRDWIQWKRLTQEVAASRLGLYQPQVNLIVHRQVEHLGVELLLNAWVRCGGDYRLTCDHPDLQDVPYADHVDSGMRD